MSKQIKGALLALLLAALVVFPAYAQEVPEAREGSCRLASAYSTGETLYAFLEAEEVPQEVALLLNQTQVDASEPEEVSASDAVSRYLFLMDLSTSMPEFQQQVVAFSNALFQAETQPVEVAVAGFGDHFEVLEEGLTSAQQVEDALLSLQYNHSATDIPMGVEGALQYLAESAGPEGSLSSLVVVTDGIPWPERSGSWAAEAQKLAQDIASCPETVVHGLTFGSSGDKDLLSALGSGTGVSTAVGRKQDAQDGGRLVAERMDSLYRLTFTPDLNMPSARFEGQLFFSQGEDVVGSFLALENVRNYSVALPQETVSGTPTPQPSYEPEPTPEASSTPEPSPDPGSSSPEAAGEMSPSPEPSPQVGSSPQPEESPVPAEDSQGPLALLKAVPLWGWCAAGGVLVVLVIVIVLALRKGRKVRDKGTPGVAMRLEVHSGKPKGSQRVFDLSRPVVIGSDAGCDLVWKDREMPARCARVFLQDQGVYIESLSPQVEITVEGIPIYDRNRIRSGDEIAIGSVRFSFRF